MSYLTSRNQAQALITQRIEAIAGTVPIALAHEDENPESYYKNATPFAAYRVMWDREAQVELGNPSLNRAYGDLFVAVYTVKGTGPGFTNVVLDAFRDGLINESLTSVHLSHIRVSYEADFAGWKMAMLRAPFHVLLRSNK